MNSAPSSPRPSPRERQNRILDAAEACFARNGFHRTTMNDVATEAGMSAGNLYRYFANKEAIVTGLTERDREMIAEDFESIASHPDFFAAFEALGRKHLIDEPREKATLVLEIWSEAARNPAVSTLCNGIDNTIRENLQHMLERARAAGAIPAGADIPTAASLTLTLADGMMKRRALEADFDGDREIKAFVSVIRLLLTTAIADPTTTRPEPAR